MEENLYWLKTKGLDIILQLQGFIQWSDFGRTDEHKPDILKKLIEIENRLKKLN